MLSPDVLRKLDGIEQRFEELTHHLSDPAVASSGERFRKVSKERASLESTVNAYRAWRKLTKDVEENEALLAEKDADLRDAERRGWKVELADSSPGALGGMKDATVNIAGDAVYSWLKYESGVHRVQRVPATEAQGRIHTSTVTVAVMPEAEDIDVQVNPSDVEMDVFRSTGSGGQSVNTTDSAVRLTHKPTGIVVKCQQEKSQLKNRNMAWRLLRAKLFEIELERQRSARDAARKSQVGTGDRSEKIRTYNFPQDRLTDHRINYTRHNLPAVMDGDVQDVVDACRTFFAAQALREASRPESGAERR